MTIATKSSASIYVLHVDDEPDLPEVTADFLERHDERFEIDTAMSASDGIDRLAENEYDCIISDYEMPGQNGIEFLEAVRDDYPDLPFILYTGKGSEEVASKAISSGVTDYLQKGTGTSHYEVLANRIRNAVSQFRTQRELERSQDLLEHTERLADVGGWEADVETGEQRWTEGTYEIHDIDPDSDFDPSVDGGVRFYHPDDQGEIDRRVERCMEEGEPFDVELRLVTAEGRLRWVRSTGEAIQREGDIVTIRGAIQDITDRKKRERELEQYEQIVEASGDAIYALDTEGNITMVNDTHAEWAGYPKDELIGSHVGQFMNEEDVAKGDALIKEILSDPDKERGRFEMRSERPDGELRIYEVSLGVVSTENNEFAASIGVIRDITERKEYKQKLERSEAYLEHTAEAITVIDTDGRIQYESPAVETTLGYGRKERVGELALDYVHPDDRANLTAQFEGSVADPGEIEEAEFRARRKNGSWQWLESRAVYHPEPPIEGVVASSRDITDRKQREQELTQYEETLDTLPDSVSIYDPNLDCIYVNLSFVDESGIQHDQYLEKSIETLLEPLPDAEAQKWIESMEKLIAGEQTHARKTLAIPTDTDTRHLDTRAGRIESESGELLGVVNVLRDVTERIEARQEIQRQNEQLENFASFISHDLRNPLNVAEARLELGRNESNNEHLEIVADAHERMETLIDNLLSLARQGTTIEELESVDLALQPGMAWQTVETEAASLNITADQTIRAEESRVQELFENLFRNAVEHAGGDVAVTVGDLADGQGFYVADDGPGIPEEKREEVFNAGYSTTDTGTGLGLEIVREVAKAHDWTISVTESEYGGTRFEITGVETAAE